MVKVRNKVKTITPVRLIIFLSLKNRRRPPFVSDEAKHYLREEARRETNWLVGSEFFIPEH